VCVHSSFDCARVYAAVDRLWTAPEKLEFIEIMHIFRPPRWPVSVFRGLAKAQQGLVARQGDFVSCGHLSEANDYASYWLNRMQTWQIISKL
jgi:predicted deacetylase